MFIEACNILKDFFTLTMIYVIHVLDESEETKNEQMENWVVPFIQTCCSIVHAMVTSSRRLALCETSVWFSTNNLIDMVAQVSALCGAPSYLASLRHCMDATSLEGPIHAFVTSRLACESTNGATSAGKVAWVITGSRTPTKFRGKLRADVITDLWARKARFSLLPWSQVAE